MKNDPNCVRPSASWRAAAAYLYTLDLDGPALAWEYLRRHPAYCADWSDTPRAERSSGAARWGLRFCGRSAARRAPGASALGRQH
jgi:hypothetical protein